MQYLIEAFSEIIMFSPQLVVALLSANSQNSKNRLLTLNMLIDILGELRKLSFKNCSTFISATQHYIYDIMLLELRYSTSNTSVKVAAHDAQYVLKDIAQKQ